MKRLTYVFVLLLLVLGIAPAAWAGPEDEILQLIQQRTQAFNEGNLEAFMAGFADNAAVVPSLAPFRIEGKEALRAFFAQLFQAFPTRRFVGWQRSIRVYGGTTAVLNAYYTLTLVDRTGKVTTTHGRQNLTFVKLGDRWVVVDQHNSVIPASP